MKHKEMLGGERKLMSDKQLVIPGLELPATPKLKRPLNLQQRVKLLEQRLTQLEIELTILRAQLDGDADHA